MPSRPQLIFLFSWKDNRQREREIVEKDIEETWILVVMYLHTAERFTHHNTGFPPKHAKFKMNEYLSQKSPECWRRILHPLLCNLPVKFPYTFQVMSKLDELSQHVGAKRMNSLILGIRNENFDKRKFCAPVTSTQACKSFCERRRGEHLTKENFKKISIPCRPGKSVELNFKDVVKVH